jgi:predicted transcriptional regulator
MSHDSQHDLPIDELLKFFKALGDANRLKIVGLLAQDELSVEELAGLLGLRPSTVSHHLAKLSEAGLVSARAEGYYNIYHLEDGALEAMARRFHSRQVLTSVTRDIDMDAYDRKVVTDYLTPEGRLKTIPAQRKKLEAVLRHLAEAFEPGLEYTEKEVNTILGRYHADTASLRRELVGFGLLQRDRHGTAYWRSEPVDT